MKEISRCDSSEELWGIVIRQRKLGLIASALGYWFVVGIGCVIYMRYRGGALPLFQLMGQEYRALVEVLVLAVIGMRLFTYRWVRIDAGCLGERPSVIATMANAFFFLDYLSASLGRGRFLRRLAVGAAAAAVLMGCMAMFCMGVYVASESLLG